MRRYLEASVREASSSPESPPGPQASAQSLAGSPSSSNLNEQRASSHGPDNCLPLVAIGTAPEAMVEDYGPARAQSGVANELDSGRPDIFCIVGAWKQPPKPLYASLCWGQSERGEAKRN